jgi:hypothetical protein
MFSPVSASSRGIRQYRIRFSFEIEALFPAALNGIPTAPGGGAGYREPWSSTRRRASARSLRSSR